MNDSHDLKRQLIRELSDLSREVAELNQINCESASLNTASAKLLEYINNLKDIAEIRLNNGALKASEEKYKTLFESANDAIFLIQDNKFIDCNLKALEIFGCTRDQIIGCSPYDFSPEFQPDGQDSKSLALEKINAALAGIPQFFEWLHKRPDGSVFYVEVSLTRFGYNSESYILAIVRDITRRKQALQVLRERENRLKSIFRAAPVGIGLVENRIILDVNDRICEMTGYSRDELIGHNARFLYLTQADFDYVGREKYEQISKYGTGTVETRWLRKDGCIINILLSSTPLDPKDLLLGVTFTALDITGQKQAEEALKEERDKAQKYLDIAGVMFIALDKNGVVALINKKGCQILGYDEHEIIGKKWFDTFLPSRLVNEVKETFGKLMMGQMENVEYYENPVVNKQGQERLIAWHNAILTDEHGAVFGTVSSGTDITEEKLAQEALEKSLDEISALNNIGRLASSSLSLENVIDRTLKEVCKITNSDLAIFFLKDGNNLQLKSAYFENLKYAHQQTPTHKIGECLCGLAAKEAKAFYSQDINSDPRCTWEECKKVNLRSFAAIPLRESSQIIGILGIASAKTCDYSARSIFLETMTNYIAAGINNAILHEQQKVHAIELEKRVIERKQAEEALKLAFAEIELLKNRLQAENVYLQEEIKLEHNFGEIITNNSNFKKILSKVEQVSATNATVLIQGETGTGKELIARAVHNISSRRNRPLVKLNCAALPPSLIESELFGHEKGAFTGAVSQKIGRFELANGGTIFLDEIGDLSLDLQTKLLRVLQEGEFERVGGHKTIKVDVRVLAATNRNLQDCVKNGNFREDLYYRLNVFPIECPPLNERKDDIPLLVNHFVKKSCKKIGKKINFVPRVTMNSLQNYNWPGNVRELENIIERAVITSAPNRLELPGELINNAPRLDSVSIAPLEEYERDYIIRVLEKANWRVSGEKGAAKLLGINPKTLESRMKKLNIRRTN